MPRGLAAKTLDLIDACAAILEAIQPTTVRGVCYQLFIGKTIPDMGKASTDRVSRALTTARERGLVPWDWIVDETREMETAQGWDDPAAFMQSVRRSYRKDRWAMQPARVMVVSEKATIGGVLRPVVHRYGVPFGVYHGFGSATAVHDLAGESVADPRPLTILYVGDHDPSGRYMSDDDLPGRLARYGGEAAIRRVAVTPAQIAGNGLPTFSVHEKARDARYRWFLERHGETCCELDALNPNVLRGLVESAVVEHLDSALWLRADAVEAAEMRSLAEFLATWPGTG